MSGPRRYLVITLAATYPDGEIGYVTGLLGYYGESVIDAAVGHSRRIHAPRAPQDLIDAIEQMETLYHADIGPAYAQEDFTFTFHEADNLVDLYFLMGKAWVERAGIKGTRKPNVGFGLSVL
jgi:hypothetical protein